MAEPSGSDIKGDLEFGFEKITTVKEYNIFFRHFAFIGYQHRTGPHCIGMNLSNGLVNFWQIYKRSKSMKNRNKFQAIYTIDDGYCGNRPQYLNIDESEIDPGMSESDLNDLLDELMREDFDVRISMYAQNRDEFIRWAKEIINRETE